MKRIYVALVLLAAVAALCVGAHLHLHTQTDRMLHTLDRIEATCRRGDTDTALSDARQFAEEYRHVSSRISCYVAHNELRESQETAAFLPSLVENGDEESLYMEIARLRAQLQHIRQVDDLTLQNIF